MPCARPALRVSLLALALLVCAGAHTPAEALMRHQVDWFGERLEDDWPGIGDRSIGVAQVGALVGRIKQTLGQARGRPLQGGAGSWSIRNDIELQEMLDRGRYDVLDGFPGQVWRPIGLEDMREAMQEALRRYARITGDDPADLGVTHTLLVAWSIKESSLNPFASPYASTSARSTATGLLQITRTTYDDLVRRRRIPQAAIEAGALPASWDEPALSDPTTNLLAAVFVLREKAQRGGGLPAALGRYYGSNDAAANARYAQGVQAGEAYLREQLGAEEIPSRLRLSEREQSALLRETESRVR
jgi:Transglycosylase SLT domain